MSNLTFLGKLESIVLERLQHPSADSYTARLAAAGSKQIAQKVGEEGVELALAAVTGDRDEIIDEAADLIYHTIVLLAEQRISLSDVSTRLEARHASD